VDGVRALWDVPRRRVRRKGSAAVGTGHAAIIVIVVVVAPAATAASTAAASSSAPPTPTPPAASAAHAGRANDLLERAVLAAPLGPGRLRRRSRGLLGLATHKFSALNKHRVSVKRLHR